MKNYFKDSKGQALAEFAIILMGSILVLLPVLSLLRPTVRNVFDEVDAKMSTGIYVGDGVTMIKGNDPALVTLCHQPGTPAEKTMDLPQSAIPGHLGHGDYIGSCEDSADVQVTLCHKPDTPAEMTKLLPQSAVLGHLGHGDYIGSCNN